MGIKNRKQVRVGTPQENQMIAIVKKAVSYNIDKTYPTKKECAEAALNSFRENSGIDPFTFTTNDCVAHHIGTLEKIYETGKKPASGKTKNIQTVIIEKVYPETYGKLPCQVTVEDVCELERNEIPESPEDVAGQCDDAPDNCEAHDWKSSIDKEKAERMHHFAMSHTALVMGRIQMQCKSWHLEMGEVTMAMPYDVWYDICLHYGVTEEVAKYGAPADDTSAV